MKLPFIICAVSPNGTVFCMRFNGPGGEPDVLAQERGRRYKAQFGSGLSIFLCCEIAQAANIVEVYQKGA